MGSISTTESNCAVQYVLLISIGIFLYNHGLSNWLHEILMTRGLFEKAGIWASLPTMIGTGGTADSPQGDTSLSNCILTALFLLAGSASLCFQSSTSGSCCWAWSSRHHAGFNDDDPVTCTDGNSRGRRKEFRLSGRDVLCGCRNWWGSRSTGTGSLIGVDWKFSGSIGRVDLRLPC